MWSEGKRDEVDIRKPVIFIEKNHLEVLSVNRLGIKSRFFKKKVINDTQRAYRHLDMDVNDVVTRYVSFTGSFVQFNYTFFFLIVCWGTNRRQASQTIVFLQLFLMTHLFPIPIQLRNGKL